MDVSIIIVNYNTKQLTSNCIASILEKTQGVTYEIILVDNASTDGSRENFFNDERINYIYSEKNGGFGYGNNLGMKVAKGSYFLLLNSDTLLVNNAVKEFYDFAESHPPKKVYGCYLQNANGQYCCSSFFFPAFNIKDFLKRFWGKQQKEILDFQIRNVEAISGADMFFHREIYDRIGGFDEQIFLYGEEGEWEYRMLKAGYPCCIIPQPQIIHLEGQSMEMSPTKMAIKLKSHFYILKKHMSYPTYLLARIYYAINLLLRNMSHWLDEEYAPYFRVILTPVKKREQ